MAVTNEELLFIMRMRDEASAVIKKNQKAFDQQAKAAKESAKNSKQVAEALKTVKVAAAAATLAIGALMAVGTSQFRQFEKGMIGIGKTTGIAGQELQNLGADFTQLSLEIPIAIGDLQEIGIVAGQLGVQGTEDILTFTRVVADMGAATNLVGEDAAISLARLSNVMGEDISEVGRLGSAMVELGNNAATSEREIARMSTEVGLATAQFKIGSANAIAFGTAAAEIGLRAELTGSTLGRVFRAFNQASIEGGEKLAAFGQIMGVTAEEAKTAFRVDASGAVIEFIGSLGRLNESQIDVSSEMQTLQLQSQELSKVLGPLGQRHERLVELQEMSAQAYRDGTALTVEAEVAYKSLDAAIIRLQNALKALSRNLGEVLAPVIHEVSNIVVGFTAIFESMPEIFQDAAAGVIILTGVIAALGVGFFAIRAVLTKLGPVLALTTGHFTRVAGAATAARIAMGPWGIALTAITVAASIGVAKLKRYEETTDEIGETTSLMAKVAEEAWRRVSNEVSFAVDEMARSLNLANDNLATGVELNLSVLGEVRQGWSDFREFMGTEFTWDQWLSFSANGVLAPLRAIDTGIKATASAVMTFDSLLKNLGTLDLIGARSDFQELKGIVYDTATEIPEGVVDDFSTNWVEKFIASAKIKLGQQMPELFAAPEAAVLAGLFDPDSPFVPLPGSVRTGVIDSRETDSAIAAAKKSAKDAADELATIQSGLVENVKKVTDALRTSTQIMNQDVTSREALTLAAKAGVDINKALAGSIFEVNQVRVIQAALDAGQAAAANDNVRMMEIETELALDMLAAMQEEGLQRAILIALAEEEAEKSKTGEKLTRAEILALEDKTIALYGLQEVQDAESESIRLRADELKRIEDARADYASVISGSFEKAILDGEATSDIFKALARDIEQITLRLLVMKPLEEFIKLLLGGSSTGQAASGAGGFFGFLSTVANFAIGGFGGGATSSATGSVSGNIAGLSAPFKFHEGGYVAPEMSRKVVSLDTFRMAKRYHEGGLPGSLKHDEVPAILQTGERVLSRSQNAEYEGGAGNMMVSFGDINVNIERTGGGGPETDEAFSKRLGKELQNTMRGEVRDQFRKEMKPGGMFNQVNKRY